ncbi:MAG: alkaline phosphatase family protein [Actinomycetota bacterium]
MTKRVLAIAAVAVIVAVAAAYALGAGPGESVETRTQDEMATSIGAPVMQHLFRGHVPGRSGEIMLVPKPNNYLLGEWDLRTLGTESPLSSTSHPNPWDYLTRVPIIASGADIEAGATNDEVTDLAALAPTYADILGMDFDADAEPLAEVVEGVGEQPKLIFTVIIDGGGWNTLQQHPESWPFIQSLRDDGVTYTNANIGSAPSITGALHATMGTGVYPNKHGIPGNQMRGPDGANTDTWQQNADPTYLQVPTVSELWDEANDNEPVVGTVSYEGWHLGMIGHGGQREGADKDIAVLWEAVDPGTDEPLNEWWVNEEFYELPSYLASTHIARLESYEAELDERDGIVDGMWFGKTLEELQEPLTRPGTPAFVEFTGDAVVDVIENEELGRDDITDLFWVEMKMPDYAGHAWNMNEPEQADVISETDRQMQRMKATLDRQVGEGNYIFVVSADHGQQPLAEFNGGWRINNKELERDVIAEFGDGVLDKATPVDIYLDMDFIESEGIDVGDIAEWLGNYTVADNIPDEAPGSDRVAEAVLGETVFAGAFSFDYLQDLAPEDIESFGEGDYPEGRIFDPPSERAEGQG